MPKWLLVVVGVGLLALALVPVVVTWIECQHSRDLASREPHFAGAKDGRVAVVYISRSGNTAFAARHIADRLDAVLFERKALCYALGLMEDARGDEAGITPRTIDLSAYGTIYLGSPIWLYAPAPPIRAFVEHNRFDGKHVVLFNTYNSEFKPQFIEASRHGVMARGAVSFEHKAIRRGRMAQQIAADAMLREIDADWVIVDPTPRQRS